MAPRRELVVTLDGRVHDAGVELVRVTDPLFSRGAGVFETVLVRAGVPCLLDAHLRRFGVPDDSRWRDAVGIAVRAWGGAGEAVLRMVRGSPAGRAEAADGVSFVAVSPVPARVPAARRDGVDAVTLRRRMIDGPWSTARTKSSSYAVNAAALREAAGLGADDAVFVDPAGAVLEGPRSSIVAVVDGALVTPPTRLPILPGTTVAALFHLAEQRGVECAEAMLSVPDLLAAQSVWLLSSVTLAARVRSLDGVGLSAAPELDVAGMVAEAITLG